MKEIEQMLTSSMIGDGEDGDRGKGEEYDISDGNPKGCAANGLNEREQLSIQPRVSY